MKNQTWKQNENIKILSIMVLWQMKKKNKTKFSHLMTQVFSEILMAVSHQNKSNKTRPIKNKCKHKNIVSRIFIYYWIGKFDMSLTFSFKVIHCVLFFFFWGKWTAMYTNNSKSISSDMQGALESWIPVISNALLHQILTQSEHLKAARDTTMD